IFEYAPKRIKQATVGTAAAGKNQVAFMVRALLGLTETPDADAADALAIGLTHLRSQEAARLGVPSGAQICMEGRAPASPRRRRCRAKRRWRRRSSALQIFACVGLAEWIFPTR